jgi:hypothetical protein
MSIRDRLNQIIAYTASQVPAGSSLVDAVADHALPLLRLLIQQVAPSAIAGEEKRALVLEAVSAWYDRVIPGLKLPLPIWLAWLELLRPALRPFVKSAAMRFAGRAMEWIYKNLKQDQVLE